MGSIGDSLCESTASWREWLCELQARGLKVGPLLAVGDGTLKFRAALDQIYRETRTQSCWVHMSAQYSTPCPRVCTARPTGDGTTSIWRPPTRAQAITAFDAFLKTHGAKHPRAREKPDHDIHALLAFCDYTAEHFSLLDATNPVKSTIAAVRHGNCVSRLLSCALCPP